MVTAVLSMVPRSPGPTALAAPDTSIAAAAAKSLKFMNILQRGWSGLTAPAFAPLYAKITHWAPPCLRVDPRDAEAWDGPYPAAAMGRNGLLHCPHENLCGRRR